MLNHRSYQLAVQAQQQHHTLRIAAHTIAGALVVDAGAAVSGSIEAGLLMARLCLGDAADIGLVTENADLMASDLGVMVRSDQPVLACLGGQYAGWPVEADGYFAMGSGPMRMARGREPLLEAWRLRESPRQAAGTLESDRMPNEAAITAIADQCGLPPQQLALMVAPAGSLAGTTQVVARSIETALHKLHELQFDISTIFSAVGIAPLPPPARPDDLAGGIGRTNDAILYGGRVTLWVDCPQQAVDEVIDAVPSCASADYGRPFAEIFKDYQYDFYRVDPRLFSPAVVQIINRRSGRTVRRGQLNPDVLHRSCGLTPIPPPTPVSPPAPDNPDSNHRSGGNLSGNPSGGEPTAGTSHASRDTPPPPTPSSSAPQAS